MSRVRQGVLWPHGQRLPGVVRITPDWCLAFYFWPWSAISRLSRYGSCSWTELTVSFREHGRRGFSHLLKQRSDKVTILWRLPARAHFEGFSCPWKNEIISELSPLTDVCLINSETCAASMCVILLQGCC